MKYEIMGYIGVGGDIKQCGLKCNNCHTVLDVTTNVLLSHHNRHVHLFGIPLLSVGIIVQVAQKSLYLRER
jgi:hypothetical protein